MAEEKKKKKITKKGLKDASTFLKFIGPYKWTWTIGWIFLVLSSTTAMMFPFLMGKLLGAETNESVNLQNGSGLIQSLDNINAVVLLLFIVFAVQAIFSFFRIVLFTRVTESALRDLRLAAFRKLVSLPMDFYNKSKAGELSSRIATDINLLQETLNTTIAEFVRQFFTIIIGIAFLAYFSIKLALIMLAVIPVMAIVAVFFGRFIKKLSKKAQNEAASSNVVLEESLTGISVVKSFTNELFEIKKYKTLIDNIKSLQVKNGLWRGAFVSFIFFFMFGSIIFVIWQGVIMVQNGEISFDHFASFILYTVFIGASFGSLPNLYSKIQQSIGATENLMEILNEEGEPTLSDNVPSIELQGKVAFQNVFFSYPQRADIEVLKGLSFEANTGQTIALVGASGAGKSTISNLLMGYYAPTSGEILFDGKDISSYDISALRANIGVVPQEVILFGGSIAENIAYGKPGASEQEIIDAAKQANAWEFIEKFPEGLQTQVGDRGIQLSGGQRQRIAIARAVLKDPEILILDEATSALDSASEKLVQDALNRLMKNRTSFVIAHRLSTIRNADQILVLENGKIVEQGKHDELLTNSSGTYTNLHQMQQD